jgi:polyphosphate kinase
VKGAARIYYFWNGGDEEYYIGSADCMKRNLDSRVEVIAPVEGVHCAELRTLLDAPLEQDHRGAWDMRPDGSDLLRSPLEDEEPRSSQALLADWHAKRQKKATRLRRRKPRGPDRRNLRALLEERE